jgi:hypothetical protein
MTSYAQFGEEDGTFERSLSVRVIALRERDDGHRR